MLSQIINISSIMFQTVKSITDIIISLTSLSGQEHKGGRNSNKVLKSTDMYL
jgi:hypothetical protein